MRAVAQYILVVGRVVRDHNYVTTRGVVRPGAHSRGLYAVVHIPDAGLTPAFVRAFLHGVTSGAIRVSWITDYERIHYTPAGDIYCV